MTDKLVCPIVNINGTSKDELLKQHTDIIHAIMDVKVALNKATPHGRDYQHNPSDHYIMARERHVRWVKTLSDLENEIMEIAVSINNQ